MKLAITETSPLSTILRGAATEAFLVSSATLGLPKLDEGLGVLALVLRIGHRILLGFVQAAQLVDVAASESMVWPHTFGRRPDPGPAEHLLGSGDVRTR